MNVFFAEMKNTRYEHMEIHFEELPLFSKELRALSKKYRSLPEDLMEFKRVLSVIPQGNGKHFCVLQKNTQTTIVKARLFCRYLKGSSLRIIYAYHTQKICIKFIELYFKGDKENENHERISQYLKNSL